MSELLWFPAGFLSVFVIVGLIDLFESKKKKDGVTESPGQACIASRQIIGMTTTNNNPEPVSGLFEGLEQEGVRDVLGEELEADMGGYMV